MRKKNVWVAADGKEFTDQGACLEYERNTGFHTAVVDFVREHMSVNAQQAEELVQGLEDFWSLIRDNPDQFQKVLNLAKPRKRRGRPPTPPGTGENELPPSLPLGPEDEGKDLSQ